MFNHNYDNIEINNYNNKNTINPYNRDKRLIVNNNHNKNNYPYGNNLNKSADFHSPLKYSSNIFMRPTKTKRFQNENLVVYRVSPYHIQYRYKIYDDINYRNEYYTKDRISNEQSYNVEKEKEYLNNKKYDDYYNIPPSNRQNRENKLNNYSEKIRNIKENNISNDNIIYNMNNMHRTIDNEYSRNNNDVSRSEQIFNNRNYIYKENYNRYNNYNNNNQMFNSMDRPIKRNNSDFNYIKNRYDRYGNKEIDKINNYNDIERRENNSQYFLRNPIDYIGEEFKDGFRHYIPESNDYNGSRYNRYMNDMNDYYLNDPIKRNKNEFWGIPPLYH